MSGFVNQIRDEIAFRHAMRRLLALPQGSVPPIDTLEALEHAWHGAVSVRRTEYLEAVAKAVAASDGAIVECGSGLTTILLTSLAARYGVPVASFEHSHPWHADVVDLLERHGLPTFHVRYGQLRDRGEYEWYELPPDMPETVRVLICNGPPKSARGGPYGAVPELKSRLQDGSVIILDDPDGGCDDLLAKWSLELPLHTEQREGSGTAGFAVLRVSSSVPAPPDASPETTSSPALRQD